MENFEPILQTLERLNPDKPHSFFHRTFRNKKEQVREEKAAVIQLMDFAESIDVAARTLIEAALESAVEKAASDTTKRLVRKALPGKPDADIEAVHRLLGQWKGAPEGMETKIALIERRLEQLDVFSKICKKVRSGYAQELKKLRARSK